MRIDTRQVIMFNYLTAVLVSCVNILLKLGRGSAMPGDFGIQGLSFLFAFIQGVMFAVGFIIMDRSVWRSGVALTTVSAKSSLILSVLFSWVFLAQEAPAWLPVGLVLISLGLIILPAESQKHDPQYQTDRTDVQRRRRTLLALFAVFVCYGVSDFCLKLSQTSVENNLSEGQELDTHLDGLMALIFLTAGLISFIFCQIKGSFKKNPVTLRSVVAGAFLGIVNIMCTASSLRALSVLSTSLYYPLYNIGIVLVCTLAGVFFFKEKIKWIQFVGIALSILAIFLFFR